MPYCNYKYCTYDLKVLADSYVFSRRSCCFPMSALISSTMSAGRCLSEIRRHQLHRVHWVDFTAYHGSIVFLPIALSYGRFQIEGGRFSSSHLL